VTRFERFDASHMDEVFELCRRCLPEPPTRPELAESLYSAAQAVTVRGAAGVGVVASACVGTEGYIRLLGVEPAARRRGHGAALLAAAEADLAALGATSAQVGADPPFYLYPGVETTCTAMLCLLERHRYERREANFNMVVDLDAIPADPGGHADATEAERDEIAGWMRTHWSNWEAEVLRALDHGTLVISRDDQGIAAFCAYHVNRAGLLGPVAVRGDLWGKGAGQPVLLGALHRIKAAGARHIEVAWVGPIRPYAAVGARISRVFFVYRRALAAP
jgi:N-acetylglutamate synthase-like GNAT family acetyltransferase